MHISRPLSLLLAASLVANAILATIALRSPYEGDDATPHASSTPATRSKKSSGGKTDDASPQLSEREETSHAKALVTALKSRDAASLHDHLRALGLSDATVNTIVRTFVWQPYYDRQREIAARKNDPDRPFWKGTTYTTNATTPEERAELRQLAQSLRKELAGILGSDASNGTQNAADRYSFLPSDKVSQLLDLNRDYGEMRTEISQEADRFRIASDDEKGRFLEIERRKDLEAILSPSELDEYDLRYSSSAAGLRTHLASVDITEAEYRNLYALQKSLDATTPSLDGRLIMQQPGGRLTPEQVKQSQDRRAAQDQTNEQIKSLLGPDRYTAYLRAYDSDYRYLQAAANRFNLPSTTIEQVYNLRTAAATQSQHIGDDANLTPAQKKTALQELANTVRTQVRTQLGDEIGTAYLARSMTWLNRMADGNTVTIRDNMVTTRNVTQPPRRTPPPAAVSGPPVEAPRPATKTGTGG